MKSKIPNISVTVTRELIEQAVQQDSRHCMIAEAIRHKGMRQVSVTAETARFNDGETRYIYPIPASVAAKLLAFDEGKPVKPFSFTLSENTGAARPIFKRSPPNPNAKKRKSHRGPNKAGRATRRVHGLAAIVVKD